VRIKAVQLAWFRGAADPISLETECKSIAVYGVNGSGKSSFVDAVEYMLNDGKIGHLSHEYSGKHQERAVPNTHKPEDQKTELRIRFKDDSELMTEIRKDGSSTRVGAQETAIDAWDYRRTVLRQNEVADFIHATKGAKYSALLPLLGLSRLEVAAENLRQLAKALDEEAKLGETKIRLKQVDAKRSTIFGADADDQILRKVAELHLKYCPDQAATLDPLSQCSDLETALANRITRFSGDQRRHLALQAVAELAVKRDVDGVQTASAKLAGAVEPLIAEKLEVLQSASAFVDGLEDETTVNCPACGRSIAVEAFQAHVNAEREHLQEIIETFNDWKSAIGSLCDTVNALRTSLSKPDMKAWREEVAAQGLSRQLSYLDSLNIPALRMHCAADDLNHIEQDLLPLIEAAASASGSALPDVQQLSTAQRTVEAARGVIAATDDIAAIRRAEALISFVNTLQNGVREEIRVRSKSVIAEISADIQKMWAILHPGEAIENVRLYLPKAADKAIDIGLKFHGKEQESPRLTLSEGYRNSLGLCIFLAMAKREADKDRPVFLDDVVVSLDRNHRGMIVELLEREFAERQVIILTHDREWYTELRLLLDDKRWTFRALLPYESPSVGIRWSYKTTTFDDARAQLRERPDSAGNDARKIMDAELALIAERLRVRLPYLRADKNDRRTAHEFLERIVADGKHCFQRRSGTDYVTYTDAIGALDNADKLLISWANRGSHSFDLVQPEASKLIDACEKALDLFRCTSCSKNVWFADVETSESVQCQCGQMRWRYGKT
jgi:hypothetical protein